MEMTESVLTFKDPLLFNHEEINANLLRKELPELRQRHKKKKLSCESSADKVHLSIYPKITYQKKLLEQSFSDSCVKKISSQDLEDFLYENGIPCPLLLESKEGLGLTIPENDFTVKDVRDIIGGNKKINVLDVSSQQQLSEKWSLSSFVDYFLLPDHERKQIYNVISLEISKTRLNKKVVAPSIVRALDWSELWPPFRVNEKPSVQKYCLMSVKKCFTDFHIDFGGTSVWYHLLYGEKEFYFIPPTEHNLKAFEKWTKKKDQYNVLFSDLVDSCYRTVLRKGQTMFIPAGWIHAVYTVEDSLVFGGNFLHDFAISMQFSIAELEKRIGVDKDCYYPNFEATNCYAALKLMKLVQERKVNKLIVDGFCNLAQKLYGWSKNHILEQIFSSVVEDLKTFLTEVMAAAQLLKGLEKIEELDNNNKNNSNDSKNIKSNIKVDLLITPLSGSRRKPSDLYASKHVPAALILPSSEPIRKFSGKRNTLIGRLKKLNSLHRRWL